MPVTTPALMTTEEFLALSDDGMDRELIRGELRERPMTVRNRFHSKALISIGHLLKSWLEQQPEPRGNIYGGEVGCILRHDPDTTVGVDVAYVSAEVEAIESENTTLIDGVPILAVEILSPSDTQEDIKEKVTAYLSAGVRLVWVVEPDFRTVMVYRPDGKPQAFNEDQEISGEPHLPGFRASVAKFFK